ncbi:MAG TPA: GNAT family N-acetyltransferase, partial [Mycobacteriales bacterium]|nr:GNAT family N-acetyltransferase [Mycobacteriales bacterium]
PSGSSPSWSTGRTEYRCRRGWAGSSSTCPARERRPAASGTSRRCRHSPRHRRQGHGGAVLQALLDWFGSVDVTRVHLHAAPAGERLYRSAGFVDRTMPALTWSAEQQ